MSSIIPRGPYRATRLWNEVVHLFQSGMPLKKHRQLFKFHHNCFTGCDAVEWLHALLKGNENFGSHVSRKQTFMLLNKFLKNHVIEDVHGQWGEETFTDNSQLYRFPVNSTPCSPFQRPLKPVDCNIQLRKPHDTKINFKSFDLKENSDMLKEKNHLSQDNMSSHNQPSSPEDVWKSVFLTSLKRILHLQSTDDNICQMKVNVDWLKHNTCQLDKSGVVSVPVDEEMPCWVVSAMKCLANWPNNCDSGFPNYDGFEKDVFKAIVEYFDSRDEPLLTFDLYETFTSILMRCDMLDQLCNGSRHSIAVEQASMKQKSSSDSDRIHKQLIQAQMRHENLAMHRRRSLKKINKQLFHDRDSYVAKSDKTDKELSEVENYDRHLHSKQSLDNLSEENDSYYDNTRHHYSNDNQPGVFNGNIGSMPNLSILCDNGVTNTHHLYKDKNFKSEANLLQCKEQGSRDNDDDADDSREICTSVEDLLLNMSVSIVMEVEPDPSSNHITNPTYHNLNPRDSSRRSESSHSYKSRLNRIDGFTCNRLQAGSRNSNMALQSRVQKSCKYGNSPFHVYHKIGGSRAPIVIDDYASLPWHMNRKEINLRSGSTKTESSLNRHSCYGEVSRSKSDIIARREVPPSGVQSVAIEEEISYKPPVPSSSLYPRNKSTPFKRLSRSHSNLTRLRITEKNTLPNNLLTNPPSYHRSMNVLNPAARFKDQAVVHSPLSAALEQARVNFKTIVAKKFESTHLKEAFQLSLLLLPPSNRRQLHLLLRLMTKMIDNPNLNNLHDHQPIKSLLIERFTDSIIRTTVDTDCTNQCQSEKVVKFLLDYASEVMKVHESFEKEVKLKVDNLKTRLNIKNDNALQVLHQPLKKQFTFCKQVSHAEYESHNGNNLDKALIDLLHAILKDQTITSREKKKKLKQFQKSYPRIYASEFPSGDPVTNEKKPRLRGPIRKLRNLRI